MVFSPTKMTQEYRINPFITIKLENNDTNIYVRNKLFNQCKILLLEIPEEKLEKTQVISSIDEAKDQLSRKMEIDKSIIKPEVAFFGHCSNIQAWAEHNYDTRLLHSNLSFPLLKVLVDAGDMVAKRVFKEEIALRFKQGFPPTMLFLLREKYLNYLEGEEKQALLSEIDFSKLPDFKAKDFLLVMKELYRRGLKEIRPHYLTHLYSLFKYNSVDEIFDLFLHNILLLLDKNEFLDFALYFLKQVQHHKKAERYAELVGFFFQLLQRRFYFDEEHRNTFEIIWKSFFSLIIPEKNDEWSKIIQNLVVPSKYCNLMPVLILEFKYVFEKLNPHRRAETLFFLMNHIKGTTFFHNHLPNFRRLLHLFLDQLDKIGPIYKVGEIYLGLIAALRDTSFLQEFSNSLEESLEYILSNLEQKEDVANSTFVHNLMVTFGFMEEVEIRDMLLNTLLKSSYYERVELVFDFNSIQQLMNDNRLDNPEIETVIALMDYLYSLTIDISLEAFFMVRNEEWRESREIRAKDIDNAISTVRSWQFSP
ncbi:hypothetical protein LCGC14_1625570 [marine sediment metagenome]|uniref:Uncharacterized protein n=1 Tax=marine sediment metagenome TaxID=412755 RepID=A0A0F9I473_9ZZZZ